MKNNSDSYQTQLAATYLLLSIADADEVLEKEELETIGDILQDFFSINEQSADSLIQKAVEKMKSSIGLFEFGQQLNIDFDYDDKLDFINCVFEVAYADGDLHYLEHHTIKKIASILNLHRDEIITAKAEIENFLD